MKFGIFLAPFHDHATNPNANLHRDLELIRQLDYLGFDEAWIGEHHSCGMEIIADPMIFATAALQHTRSIKLGTGVLSVPYHNPLWTADRIIMLDHLSRGRFMFGAGPGALPTDAHMIGIPPSELRRMLEEGMEAIMHLLRSDDPLTMTTDWFELVDAKCQLPLYSDIDIAVAAVVSPSGPRLAGRYGIGLLSVGATMQTGEDVLAKHYDVWRDVAAEHGHSADRDTWRLVGAMHLAETREQALRDVEHGIEEWFDYMQHTAAAPQFAPEGDTLQARIAWVNESGIGAIGTAEDCIKQIESLWSQSGGFGGYLCMDHDFANPVAKARSYELLAQRVMPHFQGNSYARLQDAAVRAKAVRAKLFVEQADAVQAWSDKHAAETED